MTLTVSVDPKGPCHEALLKLPRPIPIGTFVPQCEDDGYYSLQQMWGSTGQVWCVTRDGKEIEGTKTNPGEPPYDCNKGTVYHTEILWPETISNETLWERTHKEPIKHHIRRTKWSLIGRILGKPT